MCASWCHLLLQNDVIHGVRRVTSFLPLKDVTNTCKHVTLSNYWWELFNAMAESWKKPKTSNVFLSFIACWNRNRSALVRGLMSNNSLFVGQLFEDKSLELRAHDLIFVTTDLQTVNY